MLSCIYINKFHIDGLQPAHCHYCGVPVLAPSGHLTMPSSTSCMYTLISHDHMAGDNSWANRKFLGKQHITGDDLNSGPISLLPQQNFGHHHTSARD